MHFGHFKINWQKVVCNLKGYLFHSFPLFLRLSLGLFCFSSDFGWVSHSFLILFILRPDWPYSEDFSGHLRFMAYLEEVGNNVPFHSPKCSYLAISLPVLTILHKSSFIIILYNQVLISGVLHSNWKKYVIQHFKGSMNGPRNLVLDGKVSLCCPT